MLSICQERRGTQTGLSYISSNRVMVTYELPLAEVIMDFFDKLKTQTRGYASLDYEVIEFRRDNLVKVDLVNGDPVDALAVIVHRENAAYRGRELAKKQWRSCPQQFEIVVQAAIGGKIIARESYPGVPEERDGEVLRRRHHPQAVF